MTEPHVVRRGHGIPLLCVHGNGVDHRLLLALDDALAESGSWERIYLDLPGFGETPPLAGRGGLPDYVDWLDNAVTELIGTTPFAVLGNSMGGLLARALAARRMRQCLGLAMLAPIVDPVRENRTLPGREVLREDHALLRSLDPEDAETYAEMAVTQSRQNWQRFQRSAL
ncbi:MAG TPA: alpha/beta fold hydrolase, partial [Candidatus Agrococcus pullicola]|nr:alpha/beta fold hydrolase [Candidatus Agrococcus pullicola]